MPRRNARHVVHAVNLLDAEPVHQAFLDHLPAAAAALLGRLEDHHGRTGKVACLGEIFRAASSIAVCPSWPHACILPGFFERYGRFVCSSIGSASISARRPITLRGPSPVPWITPTTPVLPMPVTTSSQPKALSFSATLAAVRCTSNRISGCSWISRRHAATSAFISAIRLAIGILEAPEAQRTLRQLQNRETGRRITGPSHMSGLRLKVDALDRP